MFNIDFNAGDNVTSCIFVWRFLRGTSFGKGEISAVCSLNDLDEVAKRVAEYNSDEGNAFVLRIDACATTLALSLSKTA